tara:strand:+ start:2619 stop:2891 length:273 start_codon:yes stop_codon:yes gene_type:complete
MNNIDEEENIHLLSPNLEVEPMKEQEIWRQKQLSIYYREGRPIFDYDHNKQNPLSPVDPSIPKREVIYFCESSMKRKKKYTTKLRTRPFV